MIWRLNKLGRFLQFAFQIEDFCIDLLFASIKRPKLSYSQIVKLANVPLRFKSLWLHLSCGAAL